MKRRRVIARVTGSLVLIAVVLTCAGIPLWPFPLPDDAFKAATTVRVYDVSGLSYSAEDLASASRVANLDAAVFRSIVKDAKYRYRRPIWKGGILAVATSKDGTEQHLAISYYGNFFKVVGEPGYWEFSQGESHGMPQALRDVLEKDFHPKRISERQGEPP